MDQIIILALYYAVGFFVILNCTKQLILSMQTIKRGDMRIQHFVYMIFYFFFVFPILVNLFAYDYHYLIFYRADDAMRDYPSLMIFAVFVYIFSFFIIRSIKREKIVKHQYMIISPGLIGLCSLITIGCLVATIILSGIQVLLGGYGYAYLHNDIIGVNEVVIGCGVISYLIVLGHYKYVSKFLLAILTFCVFCFFWIVGKRYIIAETMVMAIAVLGMNGVLSGKKMIRYSVIGATLIVCLGFLYGVFFKENVTSFLDYLNVDFSRQYTLVYQFYCDRIGRQISPNPFDGIVFLLTFYVPRFMWEDKPYPFVNYLTLSLVGQDEVEFTNAGWATTCSVFSDLFDSLWYFGLALGIFLFVRLFRWINHTNKLHWKILLIYLVIKMITVQISSAIIQITIVGLAMLVYGFFTKKKKVAIGGKI